MFCLCCKGKIVFCLDIIILGFLEYVIVCGDFVYEFLYGVGFFGVY